MLHDLSGRPNMRELEEQLRLARVSSMSLFEPVNTDDKLARLEKVKELRSS